MKLIHDGLDWSKKMNGMLICTPGHCYSDMLISDMSASLQVMDETAGMAEPVPPLEGGEGVLSKHT